MVRNKSVDLNNHLFEQLERLNDVELKGDDLKEEQEFPQDGDDYWYLGDEGDILNESWDGLDFEEYRLVIGNIFKTKEQAEFAGEKLKIEAELRKFSTPYICGESMMLNYHLKSKCLVNVVADTTYKEMGEFYFENNDKINEARETVGEDRIKKYIFGVEE